MDFDAAFPKRMLAGLLPGMALDHDSDHRNMMAKREIATGFQRFTSWLVSVYVRGRTPCTA